MWILPTYRRPERCQETLDSIAAAGPSEGVVWVDGGGVDDYTSMVMPNGWRTIYSLENLGVCGALNAALAKFPDEPWYGFVTDDSIVRTHGWSAALVKQAGRNGFANSGDNWQANRRMHGAVVFGGDLLRAIGYWAPPTLNHSGVDDAWERLGQALSNWTHVPQVLVEHRHHGNGKAEQDESYRKSQASFDDDRIAFSLWLRSGLSEAVARAAPVVTDNAQRARMMRARSRRVMIATPVARAPALAYTLSLVETVVALQREGIDCARHFVVGSSNLPVARNQACAAFLASNCTDLLFIDDDMGWKPESVIRLLASDKPIAAVVGRKRWDSPNTDPAVWCGRPVSNPDGSGIIQDDMGLIKFERVGTGFIKIARTAFETLIAAHPEWKAVGKAEMTPEVKSFYYRFFKFGNDEFEGGEDFEFCNAWRALGGEIWVDPEQKISHIGEKDYAGAFSEIMSAAPVETAA